MFENPYRKIKQLEKLVSELKSENQNLRINSNRTPHWVPFPPSLLPDDLKDIHKVALDKAINDVSSKLRDELAVAMCRIDYDHYTVDYGVVSYASTVDHKIASFLIRIPAINCQINL